MRWIVLFAPLFALALSACETTNEDDWTGSGLKPFDQAERTCETQAQSIAEEGRRPDFFTGCMRALGWAPKPGTRYATPATAPDPT